jgi:U3 small nucleolar RNA-associated protein MPP10
LPELIIDTKLVDNEQIYQQLQLYNNEASSSLGSLAKFFSKCLVSIDSVSFNVELKKSSRSASENGGTTTDNLEDDDSNDGDEDEDNFNSSASASDDDDDANLSDDSVENMLKNSKIKAEIKSKSKKLSNKTKIIEKDTEFGIPDGSDSEIEDFEVNPNEEEEEEDDEEEEEVDGEEEIEQEEEEDNDDIDSDEVDEDLVDLYTDLGDEKEVMGIGKPSKSFNQIDFDKEDFGLDDEDENEEETAAENDYDNEPNEVEKELINTKNKQQNRDLFNVDNDKEEEDEKEKKSSFEIRQSKLKEQVDDIHKSMLNDLTDKSWQLSGETSAKTRPKESLLEEFLEFDHTTRKAPINSGKTTEELESLIKQRIKDKAFDDVERKIKPVEMNYEFKKEIALDHEKSKIGLSEVYEQDYLKQQQNGTEVNFIYQIYI